MPEDFNSLSAYCVNYMDHITNLLVTLQVELDRNVQVKNQHVSVSKKSLTVFGFPYFKDQTLYHPPPNQDTLTKKMNKELDPWIEFAKPFTKDDRKKLKGFVREDALARKTARIKEEKEYL